MGLAETVVAVEGGNVECATHEVLVDERYEVAAYGKHAAVGSGMKRLHHIVGLYVEFVTQVAECETIRLRLITSCFVKVKVSVNQVYTTTLRTHVYASLPVSAYVHGGTATESARHVACSLV